MAYINTGSNYLELSVPNVKLSISSSGDILASGNLIFTDLNYNNEITYSALEPGPFSNQYNTNYYQQRLYVLNNQTQNRPIGFYQSNGTYGPQVGFGNFLGYGGKVINASNEIYNIGWPLINYGGLPGNDLYNGYCINMYNLTYNSGFSSIFSPRWWQGYLAANGNNTGGFVWDNFGSINRAYIGFRVPFGAPSFLQCNNIGDYNTSNQKTYTQVNINENLTVTGSLSVGIEGTFAVTSSTIIAPIQVSGNVIPFADKNSDMNLGASNYKWRDVYAANTTIKTSDRDFKTDIKESAFGLQFIKDLNPVKYKYINGNRIHYGLIAQDVKDILDRYNLDSKDFAGYIKEENNTLSLRYEEFLSPLIKAIQELSARINALEKEIEARGL